MPVPRLIGVQQVTFNAAMRAHNLGEFLTVFSRCLAWPHVESGKLKLPIDRTFPLDKAADALAHMRANAHFGKIVLVA